MSTLHLTLAVNADRTITVPLPPDVAPGATAVAVVVEVEPAPDVSAKREPMRFSTYDVGIVDPDFRYRREDLYGNGDL